MGFVGLVYWLRYIWCYILFTPSIPTVVVHVYPTSFPMVLNLNLPIKSQWAGFGPESVRCCHRLLYSGPVSDHNYISINYTKTNPLLMCDEAWTTRMHDDGSHPIICMSGYIIRPTVVVDNIPSRPENIWCHKNATLTLKCCPLAK